MVFPLKNQYFSIVKISLLIVRSYIIHCRIEQKACRGRDRMVVGITCAHHHWCCEFESC